MTETREQCRARLLALAAQHNPAHTTPKLVEQWVEAELRLRGYEVEK